MTDDETDRPRATRRRRLRVLQRRPVEPDRRTFLVGGVLLAAGGGVMASAALDGVSRTQAEGDGAPIRPPTASMDDAKFQSQCVRCGLCGTVCENGCIRFYELDERRHGAFTPYLDVRRRACTLCMRCTQICPSGALTAVEDDVDAIVAGVSMGLATVDPELCLSYQGRACGYCRDACPIPGRAIKLFPPALPVVLDECVGCGQCVEACPQLPTAIRVERTEA